MEMTVIPYGFESLYQLNHRVNNFSSVRLIYQKLMEKRTARPVSKRRRHPSVFNGCCDSMDSAQYSERGEGS
jgi:hypothetical protein